MSTYMDMESVFPEEHNTLQVAKCADCADRLVTKRVLAERQRILDAFDAVLKRRQRPADQVEFADFLRSIVEVPNEQ